MPRQFLFALGVAISCTILHSASYGQITVGAKVFVNPSRFNDGTLKEGNRTVCMLADLDWPCVVEQVNGEWFWIGDTKFHGWVQSTSVVTIDELLRQASEEVRRTPTAGNYGIRGSAWFCKGEYDFAIKDISEAIRLEPANGKYFRNRGEAWLAKNEFQIAITDLSEAIRLSPQKPSRQYEVYRLRATAYEKLGDKNAAEADRREAERIKRSLPQ